MLMTHPPCANFTSLQKNFLINFHFSLTLLLNNSFLFESKLDLGGLEKDKQYATISSI